MITVGLGLLIACGALALGWGLAQFSRKWEQESIDALAKETIDQEWKLIPEEGLREKGFTLWRVLNQPFDSNGGSFFQRIRVFQDQNRNEVAQQIGVQKIKFADGRIFDVKFEAEFTFEGWPKEGSRVEVHVQTGSTEFCTARILQFERDEFYSWGGPVEVIWQGRKFDLGGGDVLEGDEIVCRYIEPQALSNRLLFAAKPELPPEFCVSLMYFCRLRNDALFIGAFGDFTDQISQTRFSQARQCR